MVDNSSQENSFNSTARLIFSLLFVAGIFLGLVAGK